MAYQLMVRQKFDEAERLFGDLQKKHPNLKMGYIGLIEVARKKQSPDLLLQRIENAFQSFPKHLPFAKMFLEILPEERLEKFTEKIIRKMALPFDDQLEWAITEATFWQRRYDYEKANTLLKTVLEKEPKHKEVRATQAYNLRFLGENMAAKTILDDLYPEIEFDKRYFPDFFLPAFVDLLLKTKSYKDLQNFYERTLTVGRWNWSIVQAYYQLLLSQGAYRKAMDFVKNQIEKPDSELSMGHFALLFFALKKSQYTQTISTGGLLSNDSEIGNLIAFFEELKNHLIKHSSYKKMGLQGFNIFEQIQQLSEGRQVWVNTYCNPSESYAVMQFILSKIENKTPFSLIRLGDGEGHFLPYRSAFRPFQKQDRLSSQKIWWGGEKMKDGDWKQLEVDYFKALQESDLLGIPCPWRISRSLLGFFSENVVLNGEARGLQAIFDFLEKDSSKKQALTSCHIHSHLEDLGFWDVILRSIESCSLISCHPSLKELFKEKYDLTVRSFHELPGEHKYSHIFDNQRSVSIPHFPNRFEDIQSKIEVAYLGEVFLVAAGFLGKFYCQTIKERGGIALDIGSAADYWLGYQTRLWVKLPNPLADAEVTFF